MDSYASQTLGTLRSLIVGCSLPLAVNRALDIEMRAQRHAQMIRDGDGWYVRPDERPARLSALATSIRKELAHMIAFLNSTALRRPARPSCDEAEWAIDLDKRSIRYGAVESPRRCLSPLQFAILVVLATRRMPTSMEDLAQAIRQSRYRKAMNRYDGKMVCWEPSDIRSKIVRRLSDAWRGRVDRQVIGGLLHRVRMEDKLEIASGVIVYGSL
jgi:hypothetical protein